jgi:cell division protein FtsB
MLKALVIAVLCTLLGGLQYRLWVADGGVVDSRNLEKLAAQQAAANDDLKKRNAVLEAEVADLRDGGAAIEAHARTELGMIKKGESFYLVVKPNPSR